MYNVGQKVRIKLEKTIMYGTIVGHAFIEQGFTGNIVPDYVVELRDGFWNEYRTMFISTIVADPSCVEKI